MVATNDDIVNVLQENKRLLKDIKKLLKAQIENDEYSNACLGKSEE